jgi:hypothetical protein
VKLTTLTAEDLAGINVLFAVNPDNLAYGAEYVAALPAIRTAVNNGLVLILADRKVDGANLQIPGGAKITIVRDAPTEPSPANGDINIADNGTLVTNGPGGTLNNESLDGGLRSNHGYALTTTLPAGSRVILVRTLANEAVTFSYPFGLGAVIYAPIPLDAYLSEPGRTPAAFKDIYAPNLIAYAASLGGERSALSPIFLRFCHSAGHTGPAACTRVENGVTLQTTGKVASQSLPETACEPNQPIKGTATVSIIENDGIAFSWNDLNCDSQANSSGAESFLVNPIITSSVGTAVQLKAERLNTVVRLRVVPRDTEFDLIDNVLKGVKRIVVESLNDGKVLERWSINGAERISARLTDAAAPNDVLTSAAVRFWVGHTKLFGAKTILAKAKRNGVVVGATDTRVLPAAPKSTFSNLQVYTSANFGADFDEIEFSAAPGSYFGIGRIDLNTTHPASP